MQNICWNYTFTLWFMLELYYLNYRGNAFFFFCTFNSICLYEHTRQLAWAGIAISCRPATIITIANVRFKVLFCAWRFCLLHSHSTPLFEAWKGQMRKSTKSLPFCTWKSLVTWSFRQWLSPPRLDLQTAGSALPAST